MAPLRVGVKLRSINDARRGRATRTIEIKINYLEPGRPGTLSSVAQVRKAGGRVIITEAEVTQEDEVVALATGTYTRVGG